MSVAVSAAVPKALDRYASLGSYINNELDGEANRLAAVLRHFEATCREPGFAITVSYLADSLHGYVRWVRPVDDWVRGVGRDFARVDSGLFLWRTIASGQLDLFVKRYLGFEDTLPDIVKSIYAGVIVLALHGGKSGYIGLRFARFGRMGQALRALLGIKATGFPSSGLLGYFDKITGDLVWISILVQWSGDFYHLVKGEYTGTKFISALVVDGALLLGVGEIALYVGGLVGGLLVGIALPEVAVAALALGVFVVVDAGLWYALRKLGVRDWLVDQGDEVVQGMVRKLEITADWARDVATDALDWESNAVKSLDEHVFAPTARSIAKGAEAVHSWVDGAATRLREQFWKTRHPVGRVHHDEVNKVPEPAYASHKPSEVKWTKAKAQNYVKKQAGRLPSKTESCVVWAKVRAKQIAGFDVPPISPYNSENYGAYNLIDIYGNDVISMPSKESVEKTIPTLPPGTLVIWGKGQKGSDPTYGHVAVVEKVEADGIWVSDGGWKGKEGSPRFISIEGLQGLHVAPPSSKPISPQEFAKRVQKHEM